MPFKYAEFMTQLMGLSPIRRGEVLLGQEDEFALRCNC
jgi:hypothetical protein